MPDSIPDAAAELLTSGAHVAHLATSYADRPHVAPVWYDYRDGAVDIVTTGQKLDNIRRNPRVALSVQDTDEGAAQWGVTLRGTATVVADEDEAGEMHRRINRRYGADEDEWPENTAVRIEVGSANYWTYD
ncbi:pyridoxamine 5'-phosphate oxidase family protein [Haloarcula onubensis]|uniref:Pyridoxamine 5'-phosphate oxidase family protein n=1 Tax=Haloarcula onubensis TaxID=2950539 RepID=A0ABU2FLV3_9EURY|nr:pyridoxamine 5'-phosphate oxidase family protein [Halomicroarcula sp. S3CR25-11]MDS0281291.1 pyridoxamine 5'-phosphate oxidase family protein [Halomicroarcula sp. S3CR25-11]